MAGTFSIGETKVRPGVYYNVQKVGEDGAASAIDGVVAVLFKGDWGPLNEAVEISSGENYEETFGNAYTTDAIAQAFIGGAKTAVCCRIGSGGTAGSVVLKNEDDQDAITIKAKYVGAKEFSVSVRDKLSDDTIRECIIYTGIREFEKVEFAKDNDEAAALAAALEKSANFLVQVTGNGVLADVTQSPFTPGTNPDTTVESYSDGFIAIESEVWNVACVDTEDTAVHGLLASFLERIYEVGQLTMAVVAETAEQSLEVRMANAAAFNSEKIIYVANPTLKTSAGTLDGYQTAARVAGMVAGGSSAKSLTHGVISGATELVEKMTPTQIVKAEQMGCLVLAMNPSKQVWIDSAINTLVTPADNQDEGWKKIRRTKTRYELISRANIQAENLVGKVDNDANGRATIVSQIQSVGTAMIEEGKLISCKVSESIQYTAAGDSCWFDIDVIDKDSAERIYLTYKFRFGQE